MLGSLTLAQCLLDMSNKNKPSVGIPMFHGADFKVPKLGYFPSCWVWMWTVIHDRRGLSQMSKFTHSASGHRRMTRKQQKGGTASDQTPTPSSRKPCRGPGHPELLQPTREEGPRQASSLGQDLFPPQATLHQRINSSRVSCMRKVRGMTPLPCSGPG